jgi:hypothetical protein
MAKRKSYTTRVNELTSYVELKLISKAEKSRKISSYQQTPCLRVNHANFTLTDNRYLVEVTPNGLIDNEGYLNSFAVLTAIQLSEVADELL